MPRKDVNKRRSKCFEGDLKGNLEDGDALLAFLGASLRASFRAYLRQVLHDIFIVEIVYAKRQLVLCNSEFRFSIFKNLIWRQSNRVGPDVMLGPPQISIFLILSTTFNSYRIH
jgi:hypothetical protein